MKMRIHRKIVHYNRFFFFLVYYVYNRLIIRQVTFIISKRTQNDCNLTVPAKRRQYNVCSAKFTDCGTRGGCPDHRTTTVDLPARRYSRNLRSHARPSNVLRV